jgi:hypothetical protein
MKKILLIGMLLVCLFSTNAIADSGWKFYFFGIDYDDFKDRKWGPVIGGAALSFVAHEVGHIVIGNMIGEDTHFDFDDFAVKTTINRNTSDASRAWFYRGGFVMQAAVGTILTAIPTTRHSDWTLGFNTFTCINSFGYAITGGSSEDGYSDVKNLDRVGYNGPMEAGLTGLYGGVLSYINLNKVK